MRWILLALLLAGCASPPAHSPRYWVSYRAALIETYNRGIQESRYKTVPFSVANAYAECIADYQISRLSPEERVQMNEYARLNKQLTEAEYKALESKLKLAGAENVALENMDELNGTCPDKVPLFKQYFR